MNQAPESFCCGTLRSPSGTQPPNKEAGAPERASLSFGHVPVRAWLFPRTLSDTESVLPSVQAFNLALRRIETLEATLFDNTPGQMGRRSPI
jgi:hypothetical protein